MEKYYRILKTRWGASQIEIRNAYRKLAKKLHPDVNDSPTANEDFIELNEAYEFLIDTEVRKKVRFKATPKARRTARTTQHQQWNKEKREKAREKAKEFARQRREDFIKRQNAIDKKNAPKLIFYNSLIFCISIILPSLMFFDTPPDATEYEKEAIFIGYIFFVIIWCIPISILFLKNIYRDVKYLMNK